jgi:CRP-like cAMP-binding protein
VGVSADELIASLKDCAGLGGLARSDLERLVAEARVKTAGKGEMFFREGDPASEVLVLLRGCVKLVWWDETGREMISKIAVPVQAFGHVSAFGSATYIGSAEATELSTAVAVQANTLLRIITSRPAAAANSLRILAQDVIDGWRTLRSRATDRVEQRLARTLLAVTDAAALRFANGDGCASLSLRREPQTRLIPEGGDGRASLGLPREPQTRLIPEGGDGRELRLSHQDIAELVGTTPFTVSRIIAQWKHAGLVKVGRGRVTVLDPAALARIARRIVPPGAGPDGDLHPGTPALGRRACSRVPVRGAGSPGWKVGNGGDAGRPGRRGALA